ELVQVNLLFGQAVNLGLGACEAVDGIEGLRLDRIRRVRLLDDFAQRRHGSLDAVAHADQNAGACRVASGLATDLDRDLVAMAKLTACIRQDLESLMRFLCDDICFWKASFGVVESVDKPVGSIRCGGAAIHSDSQLSPLCSVAQDVADFEAPLKGGGVQIYES